MKNWIELEFPGTSINVGFARAAIAHFAAQLDITLDELEDIKVAVSEAVSNSVVHGYRAKQGNVVVRASYDDNQLEIVIEDFGHGIPDIEVAQETGFTTIPEERMGLGLTFMREYMDELRLYSQVEVGTKVVMVKHIPQLQTG